MMEDESPLTATSAEGDSEGSGAEDEPGGAAAGGGATADTTSEDAAAACVGFRHWAGRGERARVSSWQENPAGESSGVGNQEGGHKASGVAENSRGDR